MIKVTGNIFNVLRAVLLPGLMAICCFIFCAPSDVLAQSVPAYKNAEEYYKAQAPIKVKDDIVKIIQDKKLSRVAYYLETLRSYANGNSGLASDKHDPRNIETLNKFEGTGTYSLARDMYENDEAFWGIINIDSRVEDERERLSNALEYEIKNGKITQQDLQLIENEAKRLIKEGASRAKEAAKADGKSEGYIEEIDQGTAAALDPENSVSDNMCPAIQILRDKYHSGCWSCLVVEKLTSAFLTAAKSAYGLAQRAGITLLWIGVVMWLLMWALKNVSSLAQVEPGNILNELIKFMFKVGLAYWFIMGGLPMVKNYFITPIMGFGATVAQQFWPERFEGYTEDYVWDDIDEAAVEKAVKESIAEQQKTPVTAPQDQTPVQYTEEQQKLLEQAKADAAAVGDTNIPSFMVPGTNTGHITSPVGCRIPPVVNCDGKNKQADGKCYGSNSHMGLDIGTSGKEGGVVFAMATGKLVTYCKKPCGGAGNMAVIETRDQNGNLWVHRYLHMQDKTVQTFRNLTGKTVAQGQQIGFIGNTGGSSSAHLHVDVKLTGKIGVQKYNQVYIDPLALGQGLVSPKRYHYNPDNKTFTDNPNGCKKGQVDVFPAGFKRGQNVPEKCWISGGSAKVDLSSTYITSDGQSVESSKDFTSLIIPIDDIHYSGPTDIMPKSVMNSILGATKAITDITAENMILGDAIMCYSTLPRGGAWNFQIWGVTLATPTNAFMWIEGFIIFCFGMLLTLAIVYYLMDMSFKIGFAVIALPIVVGLWPFNMTKGKLAMCVSIIAKAAATFAFLALTTTYTVALTEAVINWGDSAEAVAAGEGGIAKLYEVMDEAGNLDKISQDRNEENAAYAASKLSLFSTTFVLLLFAFLYSFKLIQNTVPDLVNKFFPDKAFGQTNPMHQWATAASRWAKDQAMKPVGYARDIALNQAGEKLKGLPKSAVGFAKSVAGKGSGNSKTLAGRGMRGAGNIAKGAGKVTQGIGKGMSAVGKGLQAVPVVGNVVGGIMIGAGKMTEAVGKGVEKAGDVAKKAGDTTDKAYNKFGTRNKKPEGNKDE